MRTVRVQRVAGPVGDAETTGIGALGVLFLIWALTEAAKRRLS